MKTPKGLPFFSTGLLIFELMEFQQITLADYPIEELLISVKESLDGFDYDQGKHSILLYNELKNIIGTIRLPLFCEIDKDLNLLSQFSSVIYLAIESGNAALIMTEGEEIIYHTTFSAYMTRKKQGFSQIKYLNKKGKSRAGSRVRLAETTDFFEKINSTLNDIFEEEVVNRLALSCSKSLIPLVYGSKVPFPLEKGDSKLYKIPLHLPQCNFTNLEKTIRKLKDPVLIYDEQYADELQDLLE